MRLREPLQGFKLSQGHVILHFALLFTSMYVLEIKSHKEVDSKSKGISGYIASIDNDITYLIQLVRSAHAIVIISEVVKFLLTQSGHTVFAQFFTFGQILTYQGVILFEQYQMLRYDQIHFMSRVQSECKYWIYLEIATFYLYIASAAIYLLTVQIRGQCNWTQRQAKENRYKFDALEFYQVDIDWFAFNFVMLAIHAAFTRFIILVHKGTYSMRDKEDKLISFESFGWGQVYIMITMVIIRFVSMILMAQIRTQDRNFVKDRNFILYIIFGLYCGLIIEYVALKSTGKISNIVTGLFILDILIFIQQLAYYEMKLQVQKQKHNFNDEGNERVDHEFLNHVNQISIMEQQRYDDSSRYSKNNLVRQKMESTIRHTEQFKERQHIINEDIYSMAFAALIDPKKVQRNRNEDGISDGFMEPIPLTEDETARIFLGALFVMGMQFIMVSLLCYDMFISGNQFSLKPPNDFLIVIPRLLSSIMMHLIVEPDIRNGIALMKYSVNHPWMFKGARTSKKQKYISALACFPGFFLGLVQSSMGIVTEYMVIIYLSSITDLMAIIMKFAAMTFIVSVDNMYANALFENKMKDAAGKHLRIFFKNYMNFQAPDHDECGEADTEVDEVDDLDLAKTYHNPRSHSCCLQFMRAIQKTFRIFYVCWNYYFMPYMSLIFVFAMSYNYKTGENQAFDEAGLASAFSENLSNDDIVQKVAIPNTGTIKIQNETYDLSGGASLNVTSLHNPGKV